MLIPCSTLELPAGSGFRESTPRLPSVLVVADLAEDSTLLVESLGQDRYQIEIAESGENALRQIEIFRPDLVILSLVMPGGLDGLETCRRIYRISTLNSIPVIFLATDVEPMRRIAALRAGAVDYIEKPFHPRNLLATIKAHLELSLRRSQLESSNAGLRARISARRRIQRLLEESIPTATLVMEKRARWEVRFRTDQARHYLTKYFGSMVQGRVPQQLINFLDGDQSVTSITNSDGDQLIVQVRRRPNQPRSITLDLKEVRSPERISPSLLQRHFKLTEREAEVLFWVAQGRTSAEIAILLGTAMTTIKKHVQNLMEKMGLENRLTAALQAGVLLGISPSDQRVA